jgi:hypothetical protein
MIEVKFEPRDIVKFELAMKKLDAGSLLEDEWKPFLENYIKYVKIYPAEIPDSKYIRTHILENSWSYKVVDPLRAQVLNDAKQPNSAIYAGWVQGHEQTGGHASNGWTNAFDKAKDHAAYLVQTIMDKAVRIWES